MPNLQDCSTENKYVLLNPLSKLLESPKNRLSEASPHTNAEQEPSKSQLEDMETLKNFNILPIDFIRKNSGKITEDYLILSPPLGKGKETFRETWR